MSKKQHKEIELIVSKQHEETKLITSDKGNHPPYYMTSTEEGTWYHSQQGFVFLYMPNSWTSQEKATATAAFKEAMTIPSIIETAVAAKGGTSSDNGLYTEDLSLMVNALNSIDGMAQTGANSYTQETSETAGEANTKFFATMLDGLDGNVDDIKTYLENNMGDLQTSMRTTSDLNQAGMIIVFVSEVTVIDVASVYVKYVSVAEETITSIEKVTCGSRKIYNNVYTYDDVEYLYNPSSLSEENVKVVGADETGNNSCCPDYCTIL